MARPINTASSIAQVLFTFNFNCFNLIIGDRYCVKMRLPPPKILKLNKNDEEYTGIEYHSKTYTLENLKDHQPSQNKDLLGRPLQQIALHILHEV